MEEGASTLGTLGQSALEPQALLREAFAHFEKGNFGEADKLCRTLLSARGEDSLAEALLAFIAHKRGQSEEGEAQLRHLMARANLPSHAPYLLALLLLERGAIADARPFLEQTVAIEPRHLPAWLALGEATKRLGERDVAANALARAAALAPHDQNIQLTYAYALAESGALQEAEELFLKIAENNPAISMAHYGAGLLAQQRGATDQAKDCYRRALEANPNNLKALNNLGSLQQECGELADAVETLSEAVRLDPSYGGARFNLGTALLAAKRFTEAEEALRKAIDLMPEFARGHTNLGAALLGQMRTREAKDALEKGLQLDPSDVEALHNLGNAFSYSDDYRAAIEQFRAAVAEMPGQAKFRFSLTDALIKNGQADEALQEIEAFLQKDPASTQALSLKSACLAILDRKEEERYLLDRDNLLQRRRIEEWDPSLGGFESLGALNRALAEHVSTHPTLREDKTTVHGFDTDEILSGDKPEVVGRSKELHPRYRPLGYGGFACHRTSLQPWTSRSLSF
jgi:tetratricopeptide (TPR) repeat protein